MCIRDSANDTTSGEGYQVVLVKNGDNSVILNSDSCNDIEVTLSGDVNLAIFGEADTITNFNYLVAEETLQFLILQGGFKSFEGVRE